MSTKSAPQPPPQLAAAAAAKAVKGGHRTAIDSPPPGGVALGVLDGQHGRPGQLTGHSPLSNGLAGGNGGNGLLSDERQLPPSLRGGFSSATDSSVPPTATSSASRKYSIRETLRGQNVFITGASGFLGKVLVEKMLRSIPDVGRIYLLIRPSRGKSAAQRLEEEIVSSECFNRLRSERPNANDFVRSKLVPISGELTSPRAGISDDDIRTLEKNVNFVIHSAASIDFNERIDRALELNVFGTKRMFEMARAWPHVRAFIHVSTCYVNSHVEGLSHEEVYPLAFNLHDVFEKVSRMNVSEMNTIPVLSELLGDYPNTYTFTKSITEHLLLGMRGDMPLAIVRPSIIGAAWTEPVSGWVDVVSAAGAPILGAGLGVLRIFPGGPDTVLDVVPVDHVANAILASIPDILAKNGVKVYQTSSSCVNPTTLRDIETSIVRFFKRHASSHAFAPLNFRLVKSPQIYEIAFFAIYSVPAALLNTIAVFGTERQKRLAASYERLLTRARSLSRNFRHFTEHKFFFDSSNVIDVSNMLCDEEQEIFTLDLHRVDWRFYHDNFAYGLLRYVLKEDMVELTEAKDRFVSLSFSYSENAHPIKLVNTLFPDLDWSYQTNKIHPQRPMSRPNEEMHSLLLNSERVQAAIDKAAKKEEISRASVETRVRGIITRLCGEVDHKVLVGFGWMLKKIFRSLFESIHTNENMIDKLRHIAETSSLVFLPTHRSYVDFLVVSFICFAFQLPLPYIAAGEDFLGILGVRWVFRKSGAFFIKRAFANDELYTTIFNEYMALLLGDQHSIEFFIEATRSRSGKMLHPKLGMLKSVTDVHFDGKVNDLHMVPVTINYEKTLEGNLYGNELLGDSKIKESLRSLLGSAAVLRANFGRIIVRICEPISLKKFARSLVPKQIYERSQSQKVLPPRKPTGVAPVAASSAPPTKVAPTRLRTAEERFLGEAADADAARATPIPIEFNPYANAACRAKINEALANEVVYQLSMNTECLPTHLVATFLLMYRQGITRDHLIENFEWLRKQLACRGAPVSFMEGFRRDLMVDQAIAYLRHLIIERRKNLFEPAISARHEYSNMLVLSHYRNKIVPWFFLEGLWACALYSFGERVEEGVELAALTKEVEFLYSLLKHEFMFQRDPSAPVDWDRSLEHMLKSGVFVRRKEGLIEVAPRGEVFFSFLCAMFWPFIDSYFVTTLSLFALQPDHTVNEAKLGKRAQWLGTTLYSEGRLSFFEACSIDTMKNAVDVLEQWQVITRFRPREKAGGGGSSNKQAQLTPKYQEESALQDLVSHIGKFRKPAPVRPSSSRRFLFADIPILAKL